MAFILVMIVSLAECDNLDGYDNELTATKWEAEVMGGFHFIQFINDWDGVYFTGYKGDKFYTHEKTYFRYGIRGGEIKITFSRDEETTIHGTLSGSVMEINRLKFEKR